MRATPSSGTSLEARMRQELTHVGLRYRLQLRPEPDLRHRADFVFIGPKVVVDVRGCYWHACELHCILPKTNVGRWELKFERNRERDQKIVDELQTRGWLVIVVWEHDDLEEAAARIAAVVRARRLRQGRQLPVESGVDMPTTTVSETNLRI